MKIALIVYFAVEILADLLLLFYDRQNRRRTALLVVKLLTSVSILTWVLRGGPL